MKISKLLAGTALALSLASGGAMADPIVGFSSIDFGAVTGSQGAGNFLNMSSVAYSAPNAGDFAVGTLGEVITNFSVQQTALTPVNFSSGIGNFVGTVLSVSFNGAFTNMIAEGTFTPLGTLAAAGFEPNSMQFNLTYTFIAGAVSGGGVINSDFVPTGVPEPMSLALLGIGLAGLGAARLRRNRA